MNRSSFRTNKYINGPVFSKARFRYMNGVSLVILARTSPKPPNPHHSRAWISVFSYCEAFPCHIKFWQFVYEFLNNKKNILPPFKRGYSIT